MEVHIVINRLYQKKLTLIILIWCCLVPFVVMIVLSGCLNDDLKMGRSFCNPAHEGYLFVYFIHTINES